MKHYVVAFLLLLALIMSACSNRSAVVHRKDYKAFEDEDRYILFALDAQYHKKFHQAFALYKELYERSKKPEYLQQMFEMLSYTQESDLTIKLAKKYIEQFPNNYILYRYKIAAYLQKNDLQSAKKSALELVERSHLEQDYMLVSDIYRLSNNYKMALKYLESAYIINYSETVMDKMALLLYVDLKQKKDAIAQLETHIRVHSCSERICKRLISFYSEENNIDGVLNVYLRLYEALHQKSVAKKIVEIYAYKKDYVKLQSFLESSGANDELLLKILAGKESYREASKLAKKLYKKSHKVEFLAQSAIFYYESSKSKSDEVIEKTIKELEDVLAIKRDAIYLNYLGYLLIDHEKDVKRGIALVQEALKSNPTSAFYIDSLAWGYYKLGKCQEAYKLMVQVEEALGSDDPEVKEHMSNIVKCKNREKK